MLKTLTFAAIAAALVATTAAVGTTMTPWGGCASPRPSDCVHRIPAGAHVTPQKGGVLITPVSGAAYVLPELDHCVEDMKMRAEAIKARRARAVTPAPLQWLDYVSWDIPASDTLVHFDGYYSVPETPTANDGQILYYFIGVENMDESTELSILQPVLTYNDGWSIASWNCCPSGQSQESTPLAGFGPGDKLFGSIDRDGVNMRIVSEWNGQYTNLTVADNGRVWDWSDVTLEVYNIAQCTDFAAGTVVFSDMNMVDTNGQTMVPQWSPDSTTTQCNGEIKVISPQEVTITHTP